MAGLKRIGTFTLDHPILEAADPYRGDYEERFVLLDDCVLGDWTGYVHQVTDEDFLINPRLSRYSLGRNSLLAIFAESFRGRKGDILKYRVYAKDGWYKSRQYIEVESGAAGFFEAARFQRKQTDEILEMPGEGWDDICRKAILSKSQGGAIPSGIVATSGLGDGYYDIWYHKTKREHIDAAFIRFMPFRKVF